MESRRALQRCAGGRQEIERRQVDLLFIGLQFGPLAFGGNNIDADLPLLGRLREGGDERRVCQGWQGQVHCGLGATDGRDPRVQPGRALRVDVRSLRDGRGFAGTF